MKHTKKFATLLCVLLIMKILAPSALAATNKNVARTLKTGVWVTSSVDYGQTYKLSIAKDALVIYTWRKNTSKDLSIEIYDNKACREIDMVTELRGGNPVTGKETASGSAVIPMGKGTYYLKITDDEGKAQVKFSTKKLETRTNYCLAYAAPLAKKKPVTVAAVPGGHFGGWYKIINTENKKLTFTVTQKIKSSVYITVYDSKLKVYLCDNKGAVYDTVNSATTKEDLAPGTYYVFTGHIGEGSQQGVYYTLSWK